MTFFLMSSFLPVEIHSRYEHADLSCRSLLKVSEPKVDILKDKQQEVRNVSWDDFLKGWIKGQK